MKTFQNAMLVVHRYLGFMLSLLFVVWFLSGFVMMYEGYPTMKLHQRLQQLPTINLSQCKINPQEAVQRVNATDTVKTIRLSMLLNRPIYQMVTTQNKHVAVFADDGELLPRVDAAQASRIAQAFVKYKSQPQSVETLTQIDQWMAAHRSQGYLPEVHRFIMNDPAETYVYVSVFTGEVVQMVNARQRFWAWLGAIPHWIYPTVLIRNRPVWNQVVIWSSLIGTIMCVAGIVMGFVRYKRQRADSLAFSPYKKKWFRWHHYTGFAFGIFVFTWVLSGLFSMTPIDFGPDPKQRQAESVDWSGGLLNPANFIVSPEQAALLFSSQLFVKEIQLIQVLGKPYYLAYQDDHHTRLLAADDMAGKPFTMFPTEPLLIKLKSFNPESKLIESRILTEYDEYYYSRKYEKRLPILRVKVDTPEQSWYYVDLKMGQIVMKHENGSRFQRWIYHGLHSLDFGFLVYKRPLWDIVVWVLMLGGTAVSITGLVLTWKWIRRKGKKFGKKANKRNASPKKRRSVTILDSNPHEQP